MDISKQVKTWWGDQVNAYPVWRIENLPKPKFKDILLSLNLAYEIRRDTIVLGKPNAELSVLIRSYFWEIVSCILKPYAPYAITGIAAIHFHLGDESIPNQLDVFTMNSSTRIDLDGISILSLEKKPDFFKLMDIENYINRVKTNKNYLLAIESPESLLLRLRPQYFRDCPQVISGFLKAIDFDLDLLRELSFQKSKPITYFRLAILFEKMGKDNLAQFFKDMTKVMTSYTIPSKAQIVKYSLPEAIYLPKKISDSAYVIRFRDQLRVYRNVIDSHLKKLQLPLWDLQKIKLYIEKNKKYDTYHSSTIEGYRVTTEEIQLLIEGREIISVDNTREDIERKMALKGYLEAHQFVLKLIENDFKKNISFTELTIREIYAHLFSPSVAAGILDTKQLIQYRNDAVFIRGSRYVPPNYSKINELMRCLVEEINETESNVTKAIIAHYGFVTVHPYFDGNGRIARFLMNYLLCRAGMPWITIRVEDRDPYFRALEIAQCDETAEPLIGFLKKYLEESGRKHEGDE